MVIGDEKGAVIEVRQAFGTLDEQVYSTSATLSDYLEVAEACSFMTGAVVAPISTTCTDCAYHFATDVLSYTSYLCLARTSHLDAITSMNEGIGLVR